MRSIAQDCCLAVALCRAPPALATVSKYAFIVQRIANDATERYNCIARAHVEYSVHTQGSLKEQRRHTRPQQSSQRGLTSKS